MAAPDTRQKILETALRLFAEQGYQRTSLREISEKSGVSRGSISWNFRTKEDLIKGCLDHFFIRWLTQIQWIAEADDARRPEGDEATAREVLARAFQAHKQIVLEEPMMVRMYWSVLAEAQRPGQEELMAKFLDFRDALVFVGSEIVKDHPEEEMPIDGRMLGRLLLLIAGGMKMMFVIESAEEFDADGIYAALETLYAGGLGLD